LLGTSPTFVTDVLREVGFPAHFKIDFTHQNQGFCIKHAEKPKKNRQFRLFFEKNRNFEQFWSTSTLTQSARRRFGQEGT